VFQLKVLKRTFGTEREKEEKTSKFGSLLVELFHHALLGVKNKDYEGGVVM
jgi:hypothetical protein